MQEELADLDNAYDSVVNTIVSIMEQNEKVSVAFDKYYAKIQRIGASRAELANTYADRKDKIEIHTEEVEPSTVNASEVAKNASLDSSLLIPS